jgi:hypothetical protein
VEDFSTFSGGTPAGGPTFAYRAVMVPVDFALYDFYNQDIEPNDDTLTPQTGLSFDIGNTQQLRTDFAGVLSATTDVDVYQWQAPLGGLAFNLYFTPDGSNGFGSTQDPGIIRVYEEDGVTVLAELDVQKGSQRLASVPIVAGNDYFFEVNWPAGAASGANDFYYLKFRTLDTVNAQELDEAGNDVATGAEIAPPTLDGTTTRHFIGGSIAAPDDDWWSFQANAGDTVVLVCSAWRAGAGVRDATFSIHADPAMAALETETEVETENINWSDTSSSASKGAVNITTTGTHYLHIASTLQDPNVTSGHYLCGIHVFP